MENRITTLLDRIKALQQLSEQQANENARLREQLAQVREQALHPDCSCQLCRPDLELAGR